VIRAFAFLCAVLAVSWTARAGGVIRTLPGTFVPGQPLTITLAAEPTPGLDVYAIEEIIPPGWTVESISHHGAFDPSQRKIKWGPFLDDAVRSLSYTVAPPADALEAVALTGLAAFGSQPPAPILGPGVLAPPHESVLRSAPARFLPGEPIAVSLASIPNPLTRSWGVEEDLPTGATVVAVLDGGVLDATTSRLKWGPFNDATPRTLRYQLSASSTTRTQLVFSGRAAFDQRNVATLGTQILPRARASLTRSLPPNYAPNHPFQIQLNAIPSPGIQAYAVQEAVPDHWSVGTISHSGRWDAITRQIKWGPFLDDTNRLLTFQITAPTQARSLITLAGQGVFDTDAIPASGDLELHPELNTIHRSAPSNAVSGVAFPVSLRITPARHVRSYAVEETPPSGWTVSTISDGGRWDPITGKIKWGPFADSPQRTLSYSLSAPLSVAQAGVLEGHGSFDGDSITTTGTLAVLPRRGSVTRDLPEFFLESSPFTVSLLAIPAPDERVFVVEEQPPQGWSVSGLSDGGVVDTITGKLKWGPFQDATPRTLSYTAHPPASGSGPQLFAGSGAFDFWVTTTRGDLQTTLKPNRAPIVFPLGADRPPDRSIKIAQAKIVARAVDPDDDPLILLDAGPRSDAGAMVLVAGAFVVYIPPNGFNGPDRFFATIQDSRGARERLPVHIQVLPPADVYPPNAAAVFAQPDGSIRLIFLGIPGIAYLVQSSPDLIAWTTLGTRTADSVGFFEWIDTEASLHPGRFYRSIAP
jgi:hypothetical protein